MPFLSLSSHLHSLFCCFFLYIKCIFRKIYKIDCGAIWKMSVKYIFFQIHFDHVSNFMR